MSELIINFDKTSPSVVDEPININVTSEQKGLEYKFLEGTPGERNWTWRKIKDFSKENHCKWKPEKPGEYIIMVQSKGKKKKSIETIKSNFIVNDIRENIEYYNKNIKLINNVIIQERNLILGEKLNLFVVPCEKDDIILYRFWIQGKLGWEPLRDYSIDSNLTYTPTEIGEKEILIEAKKPSSSNNVDDFLTIKFNVKEKQSLEINSFECLNEDILTNEELIFKVGCNLSNSQNILYKFFKVDKNGKMYCIQDYSTKNIVKLIEREKGEYKVICYIRDIFSNKPYDDRAAIVYSVKPYNDIKIRSFTSDLISPQLQGNNITFKSSVVGGKEILYRYIVEGPVAEDTGYIRSRIFDWESKLDGEYKIILKVKDISSEEEYEDKKEMYFKIEKKGDKPIKILDIISNKDKKCVVGDPINIKVKAEGGTELKYSFIVYKDGIENERINYGLSNWVNFTPEESGEYEIEVRVLDKYSEKEYDTHEIWYLKVKDYREAEIDYVLLTQKEVYLVGDTIEIKSIIQNTKNILLRYVTKINGYEIEDTGFIESDTLKIKPKRAGKYTVEIYAKNILCKEDYDSKKEVSIYVNEAMPVINTKIKANREIIIQEKDVTFEVYSEGGRDVLYEFYIMENGNWIKVQDYSKKNYYTFIPFNEGNYKILVLSKSYYRKVNYEDYCEYEFKVI